MSTPATPVLDPTVVPASEPIAPLGEDWFNEPPPATPPTAPFLKVNDTTVYNTPEAAVEGYNQAQTRLAELRQQVDYYRRVLAGDPTAQPAGPQAPALHALDLAIQPNAQDTTTFDRYLDQRFDQVLQQRLGQLTPMISYAAASRAKVEAARFDPNIPGFLDSPAYSRVMQQPQFQPLREAIEAASANPQMHAMLPNLYYYAYLGGKALASAEPPKPQRTTPPATTAPPQTTTVGTGERWAENDPRWNQPLSSFSGWGELVKK